MIITENLTIGSKDFTRKYSDKNVYIENESGQRYAEAIDLVDHPHDYTETDIPIEGDTGGLTVGDTLQIPTQEENDEFQEILDYYVDGIKKGYISNNDIPLKYRDKIVEYLK